MTKKRWFGRFFATIQELVSFKIPDPRLIILELMVDMLKKPRKSQNIQITTSRLRWIVQPNRKIKTEFLTFENRERKSI